MSEIGVLFNSHSFIVYEDTVDLVAGRIMCVITIIGIIPLIMILLSSLRSKDTISPGTMLIINLAVSDILVCAIVLVSNLANTASGGWALGYIGCAVSAVITVCCCAASLLTMFCITIERYVTVIHEIPLFSVTVKRWITFIWIYSVILGLFPLMVLEGGYGYSLELSKCLCAISWASSRPLVVFDVFFCFVTIATPIFYKVFAYFHIIKKLYGKKTDAISPKAGNFNIVDEKKRLIKMMAIDSCFLICWLPYLIKILVVMITKDQGLPVIDALCSILCILNSAIDPFIFMVFDFRIKSNLENYFGIKINTQALWDSTLVQRSRRASLYLKRRVSRVTPDNDKSSISSSKAPTVKFANSNKAGAEIFASAKVEDTAVDENSNLDGKLDKSCQSLEAIAEIANDHEIDALHQGLDAQPINVFIQQETDAQPTNVEIRQDVTFEPVYVETRQEADIKPSNIAI